MKKKAYIQDFAFFGVFLLIFLIVILIGSRIFTDYNESYQELNTSSTGIGQSLMNDYTSRYSSLYDWIFLSTAILFSIGLLISFFLIDTHPAFFFIILILFIFIIIVNGIIGEVYERFTADEFAGEAAAFSMTDYLMNNWVMFIVIIGMVGLGVLFAKMRTSVFR